MTEASRLLLEAADFPSGVAAASRVLGEATGVDRSVVLRYDYGDAVAHLVAECSRNGLALYAELHPEPWLYQTYRQAGVCCWKVKSITRRVICDGVLRGCPQVSRIVPGRIKVRKGNSRGLKLQYPTDAGLKCQYHALGTVQEVFLICTDQEAARLWLEQSGLLD